MCYMLSAYFMTKNFVRSDGLQWLLSYKLQKLITQKIVSKDSLVVQTNVVIVKVLKKAL